METLFVQATRQKYRFPSVRGELTVESLWDVPLRSRDDFNLDRIAGGVNRELKAAEEESFVETRANPAKKILQNKLDIVKYVIATKLEDEEAAKTRADNKVKKEQLLRILAEKQAGKLSAMSEKELQKQIDALSE